MRIVRLAESGANQHARRGYLLTLTAPSPGEHRMWRAGAVRGEGPWPVACHCSRSLPRPDGDDDHGALGRWNRTAGRRWNAFRTSLARTTQLDFFRTVEVQARGAIHLHVLVLTVDPLDVHQVQAQALAAGFGCVLDLAVLDPARHARYVAKYVSKACDARDDLPWLEDLADEVTGEAVPCWSRPTFRAWSSSRGWGLTMAALVLRVRERMARQAAELALREPLPAWDAVRTGPDLSPGPAP